MPSHFLKAHLLVRSKTQVNATIYEQLRGITRWIKIYRYGFKIICQHYDKILILTPNLPTVCARVHLMLALLC
jgi:hypothetical protein